MCVYVQTRETCTRGVKTDRLVSVSDTFLISSFLTKSVPTVIIINAYCLMCRKQVAVMSVRGCRVRTIKAPKKVKVKLGHIVVCSKA